MPLYTVIVSSDNPTPQVVIAGQQNGGNGAQNAGVQNGGNGAQNAGVQNGGNGAQNAGVQNAGNGAQNAGVQNGGNGAQAPNHGAQNGGNGAQAQNPEPLTYSTFLPSAVPTASELIDHSTIPEFVGVSGSTLTLTVSANNKITVTGLPHLLEVDVSRYGRPISATNTDWWEFDNPWFWPHRKYWYHKNKRILSIFDVTDQRIRDLVELVEELAETRTPFVETVLGFSHTETLNIAQHAAHANDCFWHEVPQHNFDIGNRSFGVVFVDLVTGRALKQMNRITNGQGYDIWEEGYPVEKGRFLGWTLIARYPVHRKFDSEVLKRRVRILLTEAAALCMAGNSEATPFREDVLQEFVNWAEITEASSISSDVRNNKYVKLATDVVLCGYLCAYYNSKAPPESQKPVINKFPAWLTNLFTWVKNAGWGCICFGTPPEFTTRLDTHYAVYKRNQFKGANWETFIQQLISERENANTVSGLILASAGAFLALPDLVDFARFPTIVSAGLALGSIIIGFNYRIGEELRNLPFTADLRQTKQDKERLRFIGSALNTQTTLLHLSIIAFFGAILSQVIYTAITSDVVSGGTNSDPVSALTQVAAAAPPDWTATLNAASTITTTLVAELAVADIPATPSPINLPATPSGITSVDSGTSGSLVLVPHLFSALSAGFVGVILICLFCMNRRPRPAGPEP